MAVSHALRRLFRIRVLEEEQAKLTLEASLAELRRLENARAQSIDANRRGRRFIESSVRGGDLSDRQTGIEEIRLAKNRAAMLAPLIEDEETDVTDRREEFLLTRVHRRQAETLIGETERRDAVEAERRGQQALSDWYLNRLHREKAKR